MDIIFSPDEVGDRLEYVPEQVIADISWTDGRINRIGYKRGQTFCAPKMSAHRIALQRYASHLQVVTILTYLGTYISPDQP